MAFKVFVFCLLFVFTKNVLNAQQLDLSDYNINWTTQSANSSESMPLVGGDIGCNVWVENNDLLFYIQRSGSLSENGEYLKLGRIRISLTPNPFLHNTEFSQELNLQNGTIEITAKKENNTLAKFCLWIDVANPVVHVDIKCEMPTKATVWYENWRTEDKILGTINQGSRERFTCFNLEGYPGEVKRVKDSIAYDNNNILAYHRAPKSKLVPNLMIEQQELDDYKNEIFDDLKNRTFGVLISGKDFVPGKQNEGIYLSTPFKAWSIESVKDKKVHRILCSTNIDQAESVDSWKTEIRKIAKISERQTDKAFKDTQKWWNSFWHRSYILINENSPEEENIPWQTGRNYQLFRYQLGGNTKGEYPTKFNGGNLTFDPIMMGDQFKYDPDWRQWGGWVHTAQNQRLLYWPMLKSGDFDAIIPQFELYRKGLPAAKARVEKYFGHKGAVFSEYMNAPGVVFGAGWGWKGTTNRGRGKELPFMNNKATGALGYNSVVEEGVMSNQSCAYHWESQLEHAYMIMEYHRFTGNDISMYMPFIKESVLFFDEHYQLRQKNRNGNPLDENGKLFIFPSTSCESYRGATNPSDLLAGLNACLYSLLDLEEDYVSKEEKKYYKEYLTRVPDYPIDLEKGKKIMKPAHAWLKEDNQELPQFYPLFPFNQFELGDKEIEYFQNAYELAPSFRKGTIMSWHQDGIQLARMGMTKEAADYNTKKLKNSSRRFPTFWGPGHDWVPDHNWGGSGMLGLQEMLMQTVGDKILLFPAWPKEWDVDFKLHAPKNTIVEGKLVNGKVVNLKITPIERMTDLKSLIAL